MGYVEESLLLNEKVITRASLHWVIFAIPAILVCVGASCGSLPFLLFVTSAQETPQNADVIAGLLCCAIPVWAMSVLPLICVAITYRTTEFAVTTRRIIAKVGLIRRQSLELMLSEVESIGVNQGIIGRVLGYGTIVVNGSGGTHQSFPFIADPMKFRRKINVVLKRTAAGKRAEDKARCS
jgi:uncharacterized membrane protein YdbT with pleckstrin-like domain